MTFKIITSCLQPCMLCVFQSCIYLLVRLCIAYSELMNVYNKIFNPLCLPVGVEDCV